MGRLQFIVLYDILYFVEGFLNLVTCSLLRFDWILILFSTIPGFPDDWVTLGRIWSTDGNDYDNGEH